MADVTISGLPAVTTVAPSVDVLPIVSNAGVDTVKATPNQIVQAVLPAPGAIGGTTPAAITGTQVVATGGVWAQTAFSGTFTHGVVADYASTNGRISVGSGDTLSFYTGGVATTQMAQMTSTGLNSTPIGTTTPSTGGFTSVTTSAGTASVAPINLTAGTNLTVATAGAVEYDGAVAYLTPTVNCRGVVASEQFITLTSAYTTVSGPTTAQKLFNTSTNGAVTLPVGTYAFECEFNLSAMSATSGSFGFALGGTATLTQYWTAIANKAAFATATAPQTTFNTAANATLATANTTGTGYAKISGMIRITVAGTVIPQFSISQAAAAIVGLGSYFRIKPMGSSTVTTVGNWS